MELKFLNKGERFILDWTGPILIGIIAFIQESDLPRTLKLPHSALKVPLLSQKPPFVGVKVKMDTGGVSLSTK